MRTARKIVIAPTAFKGSLDPVQAAEAMQRGVQRAAPDSQTVLLPLADGGDGMLKCLTRSGACGLRQHPVHDALGRLHTAPYGVSPDGMTGYIEMAQVCGLAQMRPEERNPDVTTTLGVGEMIAHVLAQGVAKLIIGLGGSATNDGGAGALTALGWRLLDRHGRSVAPCPQGLLQIHHVIPSPCTHTELEVVLAADVRNPLLGRYGATKVFAPQKGATNEMLLELERALRRWAVLVHQVTGRRISRVPGAGAAGGLAFGLLAHFPQATIVSGAELVMQAVGFYDALQCADLILTGEGRVDESTFHGKLLFRVLRAAAKRRTPVGIVCGEYVGDPAVLGRYNVVACRAIASGGIARDEAIRRAAEFVEAETAKLLQHVNRLLDSSHAGALHSRDEKVIIRET